MRNNTHTNFSQTLAKATFCDSYCSFNWLTRLFPSKFNCSFISYNHIIIFRMFGWRKLSNLIFFTFLCQRLQKFSITFPLYPAVQLYKMINELFSINYINLFTLLRFVRGQLWLKQVKFVSPGWFMRWVNFSKTYSQTVSAHRRPSHRNVHRPSHCIRKPSDPII